jgi:hypothetical protein
MVRSMREESTTRPNRLLALAALVALGAGAAAGEEPAAMAQAGFDAYVHKVEARLAIAHRGADTYLAPADWRRVRAGEPVIEELTEKNQAEPPGALIHDWRGTAFAPGATAAEFERALRDFAAYPREFAPQVVSARATEQDADHAQAVLRVRQQHVITVVLDTTYDISYAPADPGNGPERGTIASRSTRVEEIGADGRALSASEDHGFLWRMNTYWSYEERDGGVYMQLESVSLTRSIPTGLGWAVGPFVESVPRESIEFTLRAVVKALKK